MNCPESAEYFDPVPPDDEEQEEVAYEATNVCTDVGAATEHDDIQSDAEAQYRHLARDSLPRDGREKVDRARSPSRHGTNRPGEAGAVHRPPSRSRSECGDLCGTVVNTLRGRGSRSSSPTSTRRGNRPQSAARCAGGSLPASTTPNQCQERPKSEAHSEPPTNETSNQFGIRPPSIPPTGCISRPPSLADSIRSVSIDKELSTDSV